VIYPHASYHSGFTIARTIANLPIMCSSPAARRSDLLITNLTARCPSRALVYCFVGLVYPRRVAPSMECSFFHAVGSQGGSQKVRRILPSCQHGSATRMLPLPRTTAHRAVPCGVRPATGIRFRTPARWAAGAGARRGGPCASAPRRRVLALRPHCAVQSAVVFTSAIRHCSRPHPPRAGGRARSPERPAAVSAGQGKGRERQP
jgi:hypothetical protein